MRHARKKRILSRPRRQRTALIRGLAVELILHGRIRTTTAKAKELRPFVERLITIAKHDGVTARRIVSSRLGEPSTAVLRALFERVAPTYKSRAGGYTRIVKIGRTAGRDEAIIELV